MNLIVGDSKNSQLLQECSHQPCQGSWAISSTGNAVTCLHPNSGHKTHTFHGCSNTQHGWCYFLALNSPLASQNQYVKLTEKGTRNSFSSHASLTLTFSKKWLYSTHVVINWWVDLSHLPLLHQFNISFDILKEVNFNTKMDQLIEMSNPLDPFLVPSLVESYPPIVTIPFIS